MLRSFSQLFTLKSATILLLCLSLGLSPSKGTAMCCVDDDTDGIWWSRSGGRMALLAGGAIALGAIAGAIAGYSASSCSGCSKSHGNSNGDTYSSGPGTQPFANQFEPISLSSSSSGYSYFESSTSESPLLLRSKRTASAETRHSGKSSSKSHRRCSSAKKQCSGSVETQDITFNFSIALSNHSNATLFTPFVATPEGNTIEGSPIQASPNCTSLHLSPLTVSDAKPGTYRVGIRAAPIASGRHTTQWQGEFTSLATQSDGTTAYLNGKLRHGEPLSTREYVLREPVRE